MTIPQDQIEALKAFGYTEDEARFPIPCGDSFRLLPRARSFLAL